MLSTFPRGKLAGCPLFYRGRDGIPTPTPYLLYLAFGACIIFLFLLYSKVDVDAQVIKSKLDTRTSEDRKNFMSALYLLNQTRSSIAELKSEVDAIKQGAREGSVSGLDEKMDMLVERLQRLSEQDEELLSSFEAVMDAVLAEPSAANPAKPASRYPKKRGVSQKEGRKPEVVEEQKEEKPVEHIRRTGDAEWDECLPYIVQRERRESASARPTTQVEKRQPANPRDALLEKRRLEVRDQMRHCWNSYEAVFGEDEWKPVAARSHSWGGFGFTIVDSLDTLHIMGLQAELDKARNWVSAFLKFNKPSNLSVFETVIRLLGGTLSMYDLTGDRMYLQKAYELGRRLLPAYDRSHRMPACSIDLASGSSSCPSWTNGCASVAEVGTIQLEFVKLSELTGDMRFADHALGILKQLHLASKPKEGLYPVFVSRMDSPPTFCSGRITMGGLADSFYEYLIKLWKVSSGAYSRALTMYRESAASIIRNLLRPRKSRDGSADASCLVQLHGEQVDQGMDHLACFAGGMFALGASDAGSEADRKQHMEAAAGITKSCFESYNYTRTGLGPEIFRCDDELGPLASQYILRPETVESLFVLWRTTGDLKYQEWGWWIFQAIVRHCRVERGYVGIQDVQNPASGVDDLQQSFFMAETLKYLYLLFSPNDVVRLDEWVFNTEAHPLRVFEPSDKLREVLAKYDL